MMAGLKRSSRWEASSGVNVWRMRLDLHLAYVQCSTAQAHSYTSLADRAGAGVLSGGQCEVEGRVGDDAIRR
jgi:hypothetical protein